MKYRLRAPGLSLLVTLCAPIACGGSDEAAVSPDDAHGGTSHQGGKGGSAQAGAPGQGGSVSLPVGGSAGQGGSAQAGQAGSATAGAGGAPGPGGAPGAAGAAGGDWDGDSEDGDEVGGSPGAGGSGTAGSDSAAGTDGGTDDPVEPPDLTGSHPSFRVMTYNVRHPVDEDTGKYAWSARRGAVVGRVAANKPDILCIQEASSGAEKDLLADLRGDGKDFEVYNPGGGSPKLIFYRKTRFAEAPEVGHGNLSLPNPYADGDKCFPNAAGRRAAWFGVRDLVSGDVYLIINAHTAHGAACGKARTQAAEAIKKLIETEGKGRQIILMGDLNTDPQATSTQGEATIDILESAGLYRSLRIDGTTTRSDATFNSDWKKTGWSGSARLDWILQSGGPITSASPSVDRTEVDGRSPSDHFVSLATIRRAVFERGSTLSAVPSGASPATHLFFADVTGDGKADQISWNPTVSGGATWVAKANGQGGFDAAVMNAGATSEVASSRFYFADLNGDKCAEKILWRPTLGDGELRVHPSNCDGTFGARISFLDQGSQSDTAQFFFADVTGDGCADVIRWDPKAKGGAFEMFPAVCGATPALGKAVVSQEGASTSAGTHVYFADVDGDGKADRLLWNPDQEGGKTRVYRSLGAGAFGFAFAHPAGTSGVATSRFYFADVTGDGKADKIFWRPNFREGRMQIYPSTGAGFAGSPLMDNTGFSNSENTDFAFANIDGQAGADKVYWNPSANDGQSKVFRAMAP